MRELRKEVTGSVKVIYTRKPALYAPECAACGKVFQMRGRTTRDNVPPGTMLGIFDRCAEDEDGRGLGNMFNAAVCSFVCAGVIHAGKWREMPVYQPYAKAGAQLERVECHLTNIVTEADLIAEWEQMDDQKPPERLDSTFLYVDGVFRG